MIHTGVSGWSQESRPFWYVPSVAEKAAVALVARGRATTANYATCSVRHSPR